eukprot:g5736.t1
MASGKSGVARDALGRFADPSPGDGSGAAGGDSGDDGDSLAGSGGDGDVGGGRGISVADLHAALTATAPTFPAYTARATEDAPSAGRASYVRLFINELELSTRVLAGQQLRRSWATAAFLRAVRADGEWADALWVALGGAPGGADASADGLAAAALTAADPGAADRFARNRSALPKPALKPSDCRVHKLGPLLRQHLDACLDAGAHALGGATMWQCTVEFARATPRDGARGHILDALERDAPTVGARSASQAFRVCAVQFAAAAREAKEYGDLVSTTPPRAPAPVPVPTLTPAPAANPPARPPPNSPRNARLRITGTVDTRHARGDGATMGVTARRLAGRIAGAARAAGWRSKFVLGPTTCTVFVRTRALRGRLVHMAGSDVVFTFDDFEECHATAHVGAAGRGVGAATDAGDGADPGAGADTGADGTSAGAGTGAGTGAR